MKTLYSLRFIAFASLLLCIVTPAQASKLVDNLRAGKNQTVVAYGTSLTAGGQWRTDLANWLNTLDPDRNATATVHNSGLSGKASQSGLNNLQNKVIKLKPDIVFIEFAINDAYSGPNYPAKHPDFGITVQKSMVNLSKMIDEIKAALPDVEIIIQTMNPVWDSPQGSGMSAKSRPNLAAYYQGYRDVAKKYDLLLIDHYKNWCELQNKDPELFKKYIKDGTHPVPEGTRVVTLPAIKKSLLGNRAPREADGK